MTPNVYIVRISIPVAAFRDRLEDIPGAVFIRELPPARVVVRLSSRAALPRLAAMPGVDTVTADRLQHPDSPGPRSSS
jgi:hypothetical protein